MSLPDAVASFLADHAIEPCRLVAAVSGGFDSTAMLLVLCELPRFEIVAAHVNHHLRGEESDGDEQYVRELCDRLKVKLIVADGTLDPERVRDAGIEAAAREVRIAKLQEIRTQTGASYIATAHHKNDQAETVLMRLFTGSGLAGLRGIHAIRDDGIVRPFLGVTRAEIEDFLRQRGETPRADRMNLDPRFLRVRIRRTLSEYEPWVVENLASLAERAQERWPDVKRAIDEAEDVDATEEETRFRTLPEDPWLRRALLHRHIHRLDPQARDVSRFDLDRIEEHLDTLQRLTVTKNLELVASPLRLRKIRQRAAPFEYELTAGERITIGDIGVTLAVVAATTYQPADPPTQFFMLPRGAAPRFVVRNRRAGDRFHPLGAPGSKKLKAFLIDRKVPVEQRDRLPLLLWNGEIVWIAGVEVSERFKVREESGDLYVATINYGAK
ncbi:MAG TPA: tRNA lysidine(34) synthetase TilS [Thermoanaerobaculia bacterium]|nr:tRNA lysidine(34) synthetase TilS [Thermoanaerobaculia bacterium]